MFEWVTSLFGGSKTNTGAPSAPIVEAVVKAVEQGPRPLTTLDVPMIMARLNTLGILESLEPSHEDRLRRMVQEQCRERVVGPWWIPLRTFVTEMSFRRRSPAVVILDAKSEGHTTLRDSILELSSVLEGSGIQIIGLRTGTGSAIPGNIGNQILTIHYRRSGRQPASFEGRVEDGVLDVAHLIGEINSILESGRWSNRLLMLPPHGDIWAVVRCRLTIAQRALKTNWGTLR